MAFGLQRGGCARNIPGDGWEQGDARADRVAARATGVGVGLLAFMITWLVGTRVIDRIWGPPSSTVTALAIAAVSGILVAVVSGRRLVRRQLTENHQRMLNRGHTASR